MNMQISNEGNQQQSNLEDESVIVGAPTRRQMLDIYQKKNSFQLINLRNDDLENDTISNNTSNINLQSRQLNEAGNCNLNKPVILDQNPESFIGDKLQKYYDNQYTLQNNQEDQMKNQQLQLREKSKFSNTQQVWNNIWKKRALFILINVIKFINQVKTLGTSAKFKQVNLQMFSIINDYAANYQYYFFKSMLDNERPNKLKLVMHNINQYLVKSLYSSFSENVIIKGIKAYFTNNLFIFNPSSIVIIVWEAIFLLVLLINAIYIPINISFDIFNNEQESDINLNNTKLLIFDQIPGWLCIIDIYFSLNTAFFSNGELIVNRILIIRHYIFDQMILDIFLTLSFIIFQSLNSYYIQFFFLLRIIKFIQIITNFEEMITLKDFYSSVYELIKLIFFIFYMAHICGCAFIFISNLEKQYNDDRITWSSKLQHDDLDWISQYINSFYWAIITIITVGYGDITPITITEKIYVIIVAFMGCGMFAYAVNNIGTIIKQMNKRQFEHKTKMNLLSTHLKKRGLNVNLQTKVKKYFEYLHREEQEDNEQAEKMLLQLSGSLKKEVLTDIYLKILQQKKLFNLNFSSQFLQELAPSLKEKRIAPEEIIISQNQSVDKMFFIMQGTVQQEVKLGNEVNIIQHLQSGDIFGQKNFFSNDLSQFQYKSLNVVSLVYFKKQDFIDLLKKFPYDFEKYHFIQTQVSLYKNYQGLEIQCQACQKFQHQINSCPYVNYFPIKERIVSLYNYSIPQQNQQYKRKRLRTQNPRLYLTILKDSFIQFMCKNDHLEDLAQYMETIKEIQSEEQQELQKLINMNNDDEEINQEQKSNEIIRNNQRKRSIMYNTSSERRRLSITKNNKPISNSNGHNQPEIQKSDISIEINRRASEMLSQIQESNLNQENSQEEIKQQESPSQQCLNIEQQILHYAHQSKQKEEDNIINFSKQFTVDQQQYEFSPEKPTSQNTIRNKSNSLQFFKPKSSRKLEESLSISSKSQKNQQNGKLQDLFKSQGSIKSEKVTFSQSIVKTKDFEQKDSNILYNDHLFRQRIDFDIDKQEEFSIYYPKFNLEKILITEQRIFENQNLDSKAKKLQKIIDKQVCFKIFPQSEGQLLKYQKSINKYSLSNYQQGLQTINNYTKGNQF